MKDIIQENYKKIKQKTISIIKLLNTQTGFFILILILSTNISFFLGKLSEIQKYNEKNNNKISLIQNKNTEEVEVIASKKGSVYHFPWCSGTITIKEENKIYFKNKEEAIFSGLRLAKNCEDIK